jgi:hypothetical protein
MLCATAAFPAWSTIAGSAQAADVAIHVSPRGDDKNPGTHAKPLASLEAARAAARALKRGGKATDSGDRPNRWKDTGDLWVHGYWSWDWANSYERVTKLDAQRRHVFTAPPMGLYGFRKGQRFYFLNVLEELDQPGEWFLDRKSGMLYFWPPKPLSASANVVLSLFDKPLVRMVGASHVAIEGVRFEATRASAVEISGGERNPIAGCTIRNVGNWGVVISRGKDHAVVSCDIFDTGDGGVALDGGDRQTLAPGGHFVDNCRFARQGRWSRCYVPAADATIAWSTTSSSIATRPSAPTAAASTSRRLGTTWYTTS